MTGGYTTDRSGWTPGSSARQAGAWPSEVWTGQCRGLTLLGLSIAGVAVVVLIVCAAALLATIVFVYRHLGCSTHRGAAYPPGRLGVDMVRPAITSLLPTMSQS